MIIIMRSDATKKQVDAVCEQIAANKLQSHIVNGEERTIIGVVGDYRPVQHQQSQFLRMAGVDRITPISKPFKLSSREFKPENSAFPLDGFSIGGDEIVIIAGPCAVENRTQLLEIAHAVQEAGAHALRGGAFKPRTSPYAFHGLGEEGLEILAEAREITGMPVISEVMSPEMVPMVSKYIDVLQIGARNMQNYDLLHTVGAGERPVLLKRGMSATVDELLMASEHIISNGNEKVILCERGIRTFETSTRNTTDINAIPVLKSQTHLPVVLDPSHATGHWEYVTAVARAGIAAGADGLIIEVHPHPSAALSDGGQSLKPERFAKLVEQIRIIAQAVDRSVAPARDAVPPL
jgi:3-deoxy-7-phosphoheptulonate synthase